MSSIIHDSRPQAALVLADGSIFRGRSIGAAGTVTAEVVFNTAMTGYQEILTDPSYTGQIVTLTYPHIGNVGVNSQDEESDSIYAAGLVIRCMSPLVSNFRAEASLSDYLKQAGIVGISDIDTRRLTRILRTTGAQAGTIVAAAKGELGSDDIEAAKKASASWGSMVGRDLASEVTCQEPHEWTLGSWQRKGHDGQPGFHEPKEFPWHVVAYDFGIKRNILRLMADRGIRVTVVPARTSVEDVLAMNPDGVFLSNGPGDPQAVSYAIEAAKKLVASRIPVFGICLGHQILGIASGGKTVKMKFGHHGANHPVADCATHHVSITSQNHGFAVDVDSLPATVRVTHVSLFDGSLQGMERSDAPVFSFQGHPEASPGPHDIQGLFDHFVELMEKEKRQ